MKKILFVFAVCIIFSGCEFKEPTIETRLQGRWESDQKSEYVDYSGSLIIGSSTIEIKGFEKTIWQNPNERPFNGITRNTELDASSEKISDRDGIIYIEDFGTVEIPYQYQKNSSGDETLRFKFGERAETMKRVGEYWDKDDEDGDNDWDKEYG